MRKFSGNDARNSSGLIYLETLNQIQAISHHSIIVTEELESVFQNYTLNASISFHTKFLLISAAQFFSWFDVKNTDNV